MTQQVFVDLGNRGYTIHIGSGILSKPDLFVPFMTGQKVGVVTNETVAPLYLPALTAMLEGIGKQVVAVILPDGETFKTMESVWQILNTLFQHQFDRKTPLIALGGGVIGDLTGFAASIYMRGIPFIQVPTTLLSQVDSSVGGKTGINHVSGKNMIGTFYQPQLVVADMATLQTLPPRELAAGMAEVIKHAAIMDVSYFELLEHSMGRLMQLDMHALTQVVKRSCEIKASVVAQDETETGLRRILNFGHTFGHAIEAELGFGQILHGEAVGLGMILAAQLSMRLGFIDAQEMARVRQLIRAAELPVELPKVAVHRYLHWMTMDKKAEFGQIKFILLQALGRAVVTTVPEADLLAVLDEGRRSSERTADPAFL